MVPGDRRVDRAELQDIRRPEPPKSDRSHSWSPQRSERANRPSWFTCESPALTVRGQTGFAPTSGSPSCIARPPAYGRARSAARGEGPPLRDDRGRDGLRARTLGRIRSGREALRCSVRSLRRECIGERGRRSNNDCSPGVDHLYGRPLSPGGDNALSSELVPHRRGLTRTTRDRHLGARSGARERASAATDIKHRRKPIIVPAMCGGEAVTAPRVPSRGRAGTERVLGSRWQTDQRDLNCSTRRRPSDPRSFSC